MAMISSMTAFGQSINQVVWRILIPPDVNISKWNSLGSIQEMWIHIVTDYFILDVYEVCK